MTIYADRLRPWAIFRHPPDEEKAVCVYRFRTRTDADAYMSVLRRSGGKFEVLFDQVGENNQAIAVLDCDRS